MASQTLALQDISDLDLNLAKNDKALAAAAEIRAISSEERHQRLKNIQQKISRGTASLFEERVLSVLLQPRGAERILAIQRHLPRIEKALHTRSGSQPIADETPAPINEQPPTSNVQPKTATERPYQSELLDFISTQKPQTPPPDGISVKTPRSVRVERESPTPSRWSRHDQLAVATLIVVIGIAIAYAIITNTASQQPILTFEQQARQQNPSSSRQQALSPEIQAEFNAVMQALRAGDFEQAKTEMLAFIAQHPTSPHAESGYMALADTSRQRQNDPDQALVYYQKLLEQFPRSPNVGLGQLKMGFAYEDLEDFANAEAMYRLVLDQHGSQSRIGQLAAQRLNALTEAPASLPAP